MTWIIKGFNAIMFLLSSMIYLLINWLYQVFGAVANVNLFSEEVFDELTGRIYLIMGIAMLFIFAYNLVLMIINPDDKKGTGSMTKVVKETIISLTAVVLLPTIFGYMYTFQSNVISSNILGQLILGGAGTTTQDKSLCSDGDYECLCDFSFLGNNATEVETECDKYSNLSSSERGARIVPVTIFSAFYRPANFSFDECANHLANGDNSVIDASGDEHDICVNYFIGYQKAKYSGIITHLGDQPDLRDAIYDDPKLMEFDSFFAVIAGALGAWMFLCYAMQIGVRVFKLGVLQLISPIPVMMRIVPGQKEKIYDKWFKELLNTYLDVFIRLIIIYFALFAISLVPEMISTLFSSFLSGDSNIIIKLLAMVVIILGILDFAREAPELLKTFFGSSGRFSIKPSDQKSLKGGIGAIGTMSTIAGKNMYDTISNIKNNGWKQGLKGAAKGLPRSIGQQLGGAYSGYKKGRDAKGFAGMRDGIYGAAARELSKPTMRDKIGGFIAEQAEAYTGFYKANYVPYNSPAELRKAEKLDEVAKKQEAFEALLDNTDFVKAINSTFEGAIKRAQDSGATAEQMKKIYDDWKIEKSKARAEAFREKGSDVDIKAALEEYREVVNKNMGVVKDALKENKKGNIDISVALSDESLKTGDGYTNARDIGGSSKKSAAHIRQQAMQEEQKKKGSDK